MLIAGWTIYRDAIQRPRFRVSIAVKTIYQAGQEPVGPHLYVEALNLGPLPNRLGVVWCRKSWRERLVNRPAYIINVYPDYGHMAATPSAERIEVGDTGTFVFPYDVDCFLKIEDLAQVGVSDGYGRTHWAPRQQLRKVRKKFREEFLEEAPAQE